MSADDGNRTRMTSLESPGCGCADLRGCRSNGVFDRPLVTVNHPGLPSDGARNGQGARPSGLAKGLCHRGSASAQAVAWGGPPGLAAPSDISELELD
jgi:hypothetical protein